MYNFFSKGKNSNDLLPYIAVMEIHHDDDRVSSFQKRFDKEQEHPTPEEYTDVDAIFGPWDEDEAEDSW